MSRRYGRFVDARWIHHRMNTKDARRQREQQRRLPARVALGLQPEVVPYDTVEIVHVDNRVTTIAADGTVTTTPPPAAPVVEVALAPIKPDDRGPIVEVTITPKPNGGDQ